MLQGWLSVRGKPRTSNLGDKHDARPMSRCLLRHRYFLLLEAVTATSVEADCTLDAATLDITQAREGLYAAA